MTGSVSATRVQRPWDYLPGFLRAAVVVSTNSNASNACLGTMFATKRVRVAFRIHRADLARSSWLVEPGGALRRSSAKSGMPADGERAVERLGLGRWHGEILQAAASLCHGLERPLVEREAKDDHLLAVHPPERRAHRLVREPGGRDVAVVRPQHDLRLGVVVQDPLDVVGHAPVAWHLVGAHLHRLQHDARVLDGPINIEVASHHAPDNQHALTRDVRQRPSMPRRHSTASPQAPLRAIAAAPTCCMRRLWFPECVTLVSSCTR